MKDALDHLPDTHQQAIVDIRRLVLNEVDAFTENKTGKKALGRVNWVVLFGSYARGDFVEDAANGYVSDVDVLVVVSNDELEQALGLWHAIEDKAERHTRAPLTLIVHKQKDVLSWLQQGHYFFSDIQSEGVYLYSYTGKPLPAPQLLTAEQRLPIAKNHFEQWFKSAEEFMQGFDLYLSNENLKLAAFMMHQASERFYACLLLVVSNYRPKSHNLKMLHRVALDKTSPNSLLSGLFPSDDRFQKRCFELLRRAYIDARYSEHYKITKTELEWLYGQVSELKQCVHATCEAYIEELESR